MRRDGTPKNMTEDRQGGRQSTEGSQGGRTAAVGEEEEEEEEEDFTWRGEKEGKEPRTVSSCHHPELSSASEPWLEKIPLFSSPTTHPFVCHNINQHTKVAT